MEEAPSKEDPGRYPKDLFNKNVVANDQTIGRVAKETDDTIVVFGDSNNSRFDIPKSKIAVAGGSVIVNESLAQYAKDRDDPLPEGKSLRASADEIRQKAGEVKEWPTLPVEEGRPSVVEEKAREVVGEVTSSVGYEIKQASHSVKEKLRDAGEAVANADYEGAARRVGGEVRDMAQAGAQVTGEKIGASQSGTDAELMAENALRIEKESKQPATELDLGSYEGRYPKDLFNRTVVVNNQAIGRVAKETHDTIVVFSDTDGSTRFDIPKSEIALEGGSVVANEDLLFRYRRRRTDPLPAGKPLRASAEQIRASAAKQAEEKHKKPTATTTTPDAIMKEGGALAVAPRPETVSPSVPEGYVDTESEIVKRMKRAANELWEVIVAGTKVAKKRVKQAQREAAEKQAQADATDISKMGSLAMTFADSFEEVLGEIRTRTYAEQEHIYTGFLKLIDQQRDLVLARRDLAARLKDSVPAPVVGQAALEGPPQLPEEVGTDQASVRRSTGQKSRRATTTTKRKTTKSSRTSSAA